MRAVVIEITDTTALVELRPGWLGRLFGARTVQVRLVRHRAGAQVGYEVGWYATDSGHPLLKLPHQRAIERALDFRPVADLPRATSRSV